MSDTTLIRCAQCGANNRVPQHKIAADVERSPLPVLVDAWAPWCGPCRVVGPIVDELASELAGKVRVAKLNVDDNPATAARFDVRSIPTMLVMVNGREVDRIVGALPKAQLRQRLDRALAR